MAPSNVAYVLQYMVLKWEQIEQKQESEGLVRSILALEPLKREFPIDRISYIK